MKGIYLGGGSLHFTCISSILYPTCNMVGIVSNEVVAQVVEREPEELRVGGSTPSNLTKTKKCNYILLLKIIPLYLHLKRKNDKQNI